MPFKVLIYSVFFSWHLSSCSQGCAINRSVCERCLSARKESTYTKPLLLWSTLDSCYGETYTTTALSIYVGSRLFIRRVSHEKVRDFWMKVHAISRNNFLTLLVTFKIYKTLIEIIFRRNLCKEITSSTQTIHNGRNIEKTMLDQEVNERNTTLSFQRISWQRVDRLFTFLEQSIECTNRTETGFEQESSWLRMV